MLKWIVRSVVKSEIRMNVDVRRIFHVGGDPEVGGLGAREEMRRERNGRRNEIIEEIRRGKEKNAMKAKR